MTIDFVYGTRPELIKMAIPIQLFRSNRKFQIRVISTGQHKEMLTSIESWFEVFPDYKLEVMKPNQQLSDLGVALMSAFLDFFKYNGKSDWVFVQGDTTTAFVASLMGFYSGIKVGHIEAGLRTFDKYSPWPEEGNRQMISKLADCHFAPTISAGQNLLSERIEENNVLISGNTVVDSLEWSIKKIREMDFFPFELLKLFKGEFKSNKMVLVTSHRRENHGEKLDAICEAVKELAIVFPEVHFVFPVHPNPIVRESVQRILGVNQQNIWLVSPLSYPEFLQTIDRSYILLTDSGGLQEEGPSFKKPVLLLRTNTERPEGIHNGCAKLVGTSKQNIIDEVKILLQNENEYQNMVAEKNPFGDGKASERIVEKMLSLL